MKHTIKNIFVLFAIICFAGCQKNLLDSEPTDTINNGNFWKSQTDALNAVNALYAKLPGASEVEWDMMTDIGTTNSITDAKSAGVERGAPSSDMGYFNTLWDDAYKAIRAVNYFLENVDKVKEADPLVDDALLARMKGEARFIRAFFYTRLVMLFGDVPLLTQTLELSEAYDVSRTPTSEVWDFVGSELKAIADDLPASYGSNDIGRITKGAAWAMYARAMLYAGRWQEAADAAKQVIDMKQYSLYHSYQNLFSYAAENNEEVILDRQYAKDINANAFFNTYAPRGMNGNVGIAPTRTLVDAYETINGLAIQSDPAYNEQNPYANRDPRLRYSIFLPTFSDDVPGDQLFNGKVFDSRPGSGTADEVDVDYLRSKTGYDTKKYINQEDLSDRSNCGTNFILIRYADVLLMYAEAMIELNQLDESVYQAINNIREREDVGMPKISSGKTQSELRDIVRHERMVELALEGLRFFDLRRWRTAEDVMKGAVPGIRYIPPGGTAIKLYQYGAVVRYFNPARDYLFPIPQQEVLLNPNLTQNPEY